MKIFLDTADTKTISKHFETGLIDGVTTNPTLIMKSHERPDDVYRDLVLMGLKDISMEVVGTKEEMLENYLQAMRSQGFNNTLQQYIDNNVNHWGIGLNFFGTINLNTIPLGVDIQSNVSNVNKYSMFMFFSTIISI